MTFAILKRHDQVVVMLASLPNTVVKLSTENTLSHESLVPQNLQAIQKANALLATLDI